MCLARYNFSRIEFDFLHSTTSPFPGEIIRCGNRRRKKKSMHSKQKILIVQTKQKMPVTKKYVAPILEIVVHLQFCAPVGRLTADEHVVLVHDLFSRELIILERHDARQQRFHRAQRLT